MKRKTKANGWELHRTQYKNLQRSWEPPKGGKTMSQSDDTYPWKYNQKLNNCLVQLRKRVIEIKPKSDWNKILRPNIAISLSCVLSHLS